MIMKFLKKIPAGMMVVPMLLGAFINTFFPQVTGIGSFYIFLSKHVPRSVFRFLKYWHP